MPSLILPRLRGVGKTTLLLQCYEYLFKEKNVSIADILYISCDAPIFLLIDEIHYDKNWTLHAKILYDKSPFIFMIFTGSSLLLDYNEDIQED